MALEWPETLDFVHAHRGSWGTVPGPHIENLALSTLDFGTTHLICPFPSGEGLALWDDFLCFLATTSFWLLHSPNSSCTWLDAEEHERKQGGAAEPGAVELGCMVGSPQTFAFVEESYSYTNMAIP